VDVVESPSTRVATRWPKEYNGQAELSGRAAQSPFNSPRQLYLPVVEGAIRAGGDTPAVGAKGSAADLQSDAVK
jgi:hypothetical protein